MQDSPLSLLPPIVAIVIAIWRKNALLALFCGIVLCFIMIENWHPINGVTSTAFGLAGVFDSIGNIYIISFSLLIGALVTLMNQSGAVNGFIDSLAKVNLVKNSKQAALLPTFVGTSIFTDTNLSIFTAGMASQTLFDKYKLSRARLAYLIDSTCAPISILFLINGWGAYVLGLLDGHQLNDPVGILVGTISYNFYAIIAVLFAYYTAASGRTFGPLKYAKSRIIDQKTAEKQKISPAIIMWLPLLSLLTITLSLLWFTGNGDMRQGSGSFSVFWAIVSAVIILITMIKVYGVMSWKNIAKHALLGIKHMAPAVAILILSFAFGDAIKSLGTGIYVSQLLNVEVPLYFIAPILFLAAGFMAFATGTSWGTFAILVPIAVPLAQQTGLPIEFLVAAVLGGGIFGDHASPISDTTVVASIASGCDHYEHVKTQLPYALTAGSLTLIIYTLIGLNF
ncbi:Na+/H+ antiporter NhaC family protein [Thalassotalea sp. 1_MG-2023]|uniref:Na+/H+ antiporter NhaC family protein n=1 Tax=Thalassotalea sp. 1_MG-2023 TaxID=3062680 RepID=UPI0026E17649|nr:Na+/H+ antiporter NhaC family protein [Thalassotalea sp. 1_MG-2023]MDO6426351.1 Na+/H+ antiporter NhaC family protein [Thalassotalea sp. 1_MG-2023]